MVADYTPERVADDLRHRQATTSSPAARLYAAAGQGAHHLLPGRDGAFHRHRGRHGACATWPCSRGNLGRSGCGVNPLRGQNNVQGACDMGAAPGRFPRLPEACEPGRARRSSRQAWGVKLPTRRSGMFATEVLPVPCHGRSASRGLFIFGEDQVRTDPEHARMSSEGLEGAGLPGGGRPVHDGDREATRTWCCQAAAMPRRRARSPIRSAACMRVRKAVEVEGDNRGRTRAYFSRDHAPHGLRRSRDLDARRKSWTRSPRVTPSVRRHQP